VEENLYCRLRFAPEFLKHGTLTAEIRNGGSTIVNPSMSWCATGPAPRAMSLVSPAAPGRPRLEPVLGSALMYDAVRLQDDPPYRSKTTPISPMSAPVQGLPALLVGQGLPARGVELGAELVAPVASFGAAAAFPEAKESH
jgi:hypothetical protein